MTFPGDADADADCALLDLTTRVFGRRSDRTGSCKLASTVREQDQAWAPRAGEIDRSFPLEQPLRIERKELSAALTAHWGELDGLSSAAVDPNPFYEPHMLHAATRHFGLDASEIILGWDGVKLVGAAPIEHSRRGPVSILQFLSYPHLPRAIPLVRVGYERSFFRALLEIAASYGWLRIDGLTGYAEVTKALEDAFADRPRTAAFVNEAPTAILDLAGLPPDATPRLELSSKEYGQHRRKHRRLAEAGEASFEEATERTDITPVLAEFLALEQAGWKGRNRTALACSASDTGFFYDAMRAAHLKGRLSLLCLRLDGRLVAARTELLSGRKGFIHKIAYGEEFGKYSPGKLLELESVGRHLAARRDRQGFLADIDFIDSCTADNDGPWAQLWPESSLKVQFRIGFGTLRSAAVRHCAPAVHRVYTRRRKSRQQRRMHVRLVV